MGCWLQGIDYGDINYRVFIRDYWIWGYLLWGMVYGVVIMGYWLQSFDYMVLITWYWLWGIDTVYWLYSIDYEVFIMGHWLWGVDYGILIREGAKKHFDGPGP